MRCRKCGVNIDGNLVNCPLCGAHVGEENPKSIYGYPSVAEKNAKALFLRISLFVTVISMAIVLVIDFAVDNRIVWAWHVIFGFAVAWLCVGRPILKRFNVRKYLSWGFAGVIALLFYLNYWINSFADPWAFTLGAPIAVLTWQGVLAVLGIAHKPERPEYWMSATKVFILSAICIGVSFLWIKTCYWGWYVCTGVGFIEVLSLSIFAKEKYFSELGKRLHV